MSNGRGIFGCEFNGLVGVNVVEDGGEGIRGGVLEGDVAGGSGMFGEVGLFEECGEVVTAAGSDGENGFVDVIGLDNGFVVIAVVVIIVVVTTAAAVDDSFPLIVVSIIVRK